jgi:hypothetical protein
MARFRCKRCGSTDTIVLSETVTYRATHERELVGRTLRCNGCGKLVELDINRSVSSIFKEMIARSEEPPNRGKLKVAPPPEKKNGATK